MLYIIAFSIGAIPALLLSGVFFGFCRCAQFWPLWAAFTLASGVGMAIVSLVLQVMLGHIRVPIAPTLASLGVIVSCLMFICGIAWSFLVGFGNQL